MLCTWISLCDALGFCKNRSSPDKNSLQSQPVDFTFLSPIPTQNVWITCWTRITVQLQLWMHHFITVHIRTVCQQVGLSLGLVLVLCLLGGGYGTLWSCPAPIWGGTPWSCSGSVQWVPQTGQGDPPAPGQDQRVPHLPRTGWGFDSLRRGQYTSCGHPGELSCSTECQWK